MADRVVSPLRNRRRNSNHPQAVAFSTSRRHPGVGPESPRRSVANSNEKENETSLLPHTRPTKKDGLLRPDLYTKESEHMPINLKPLPKLENSVPEQDITLASTRPPAFTTVKRQPTDSTFSYLRALGKAYFTFYKTGLKNLWANRKEMKALQLRIDPFTVDAAARYGGSMYTNKQGNAVTIPHISRRDFQLFYRTKADLRKMIPFGLLLLVCGEFTPIALLVLGRRAVPKVSYLPFQQREEMDDTVKRFKNWRTEMTKLTAVSAVDSPRHPFDYTPKGGRLEHPWRRDFLFAYLVGQSNFRRPPLTISRSAYWRYALMPRLQRYWDNIFCDTILIQRQGGFKAMSPQDIYEYARNYGSLTLMAIMEKHVGRKDYDFINESLKKKLVPILEQEAAIMLDDDFTRLPPSLHYARAYRDTARWARSPDVIQAISILNTPEQPDAKQIQTMPSTKKQAISKA